MIDKTYWLDVVSKLKEESKAVWAAQVLSSNIEILDELLPIIGRKSLIKNCLLCYSITLSAQPYLDEVLSNFSIKELIHVYKNLEKKPIQTAGATMWLLEDIDPEFKWAI